MPKRIYPTSSTKKVYPVIGIVKSSSSKYAMVTSITEEGVAVRVNGHKINLNMAPKDKHGVVKVLELRRDNKVWTSGVLYFDPATGEYFPEKEEGEEENCLRCNETLKTMEEFRKEHEDAMESARRAKQNEEEKEGEEKKKVVKEPTDLRFPRAE